MRAFRATTLRLSVACAAVTVSAIALTSGRLNGFSWG